MAVYRRLVTVGARSSRRASDLGNTIFNLMTTSILYVFWQPSVAHLHNWWVVIRTNMDVLRQLAIAIVRSRRLAFVLGNKVWGLKESLMQLARRDKFRR